MSSPSSKPSNLEFLQKIVKGEPISGAPFHFPPAIAKMLGFQLVEIASGVATIEIQTNTEVHANPMGTLHGGVLCDIADAAIGTAHSSTLKEGETFTSLDLQINFFRPVWNEKLRATAKPVHPGKTVSRYVCDVRNAEGKLVAQVTSSVITLRGDAAKGR
jgi:uncharacterized protein (TIGR00369 family)